MSEIRDLLEEQIQHELKLFDTEEAKQNLSKDWVDGYKRGIDWLFMRVKTLLSKDKPCPPGPEVQGKPTGEMASGKEITEINQNNEFEIYEEMVEIGPDGNIKSKCPHCKETLPGILKPHTCNPTYQNLTQQLIDKNNQVQQLQAELEQVEDKNKEMQIAGEILQLECNELQVERDNFKNKAAQANMFCNNHKEENAKLKAKVDQALRQKDKDNG